MDDKKIKVDVKECSFGKKVIELGEKEDRSFYEVTFFYSDPDVTEEVYILANEDNLEMIIMKFQKECDSLFAVAYKEIGKEF